ncbi:unnamed protein product [Cylindrotheca closterium]|uniref:Exonuclease domain-containing protein n=1 Tax=Cylindrotheca closterium TaxID=2856 RepID=A0AAD2CJT5_9STRA|nr:unnamed protein product [Cylindrotheca closterium]
MPDKTAHHAFGSYRHSSTRYSKDGVDTRFQQNDHTTTTNDSKSSLPLNKKKVCKRNNTVRLPKHSEIVALDCEMVGVGEKGRTSSAAWITIIDFFGNTILDQHISQDEPVTDYRTEISGITEQDLQAATITLNECRELVLNILQGRILVGHSLKSDLNALGIAQHHHPWWLIRDTTRYTPFLQDRNRSLMPRKLRDLAKEYLHRDIQVPGMAHSPYEDALASLDLYKSVRPKWEAVMIFKVKKTRKIQREQQTRQ